MEECSICLDELVGTIVVLDCKHKYHDICIGTWYESNIKNNSEFVCPQCNLATDIKTIINVETQDKEEITIDSTTNTHLSNTNTHLSNTNRRNTSNNYTINNSYNNTYQSNNNTYQSNNNRRITRNNYTIIPITNIDQEIDDDIELTRKKCLRCCIL